MTEHEINKFVQPYKKEYGWSLVARSGNGNQIDDTYLYHFVDDANICIIINPVNKGFAFRKTVDFLFKFQSDEFTPLDYPDHFEKNYLRFRKIVLQRIIVLFSVYT